ncbi:hypothetical protein JOM56_007315 [Amanita muscaria]
MLHKISRSPALLLRKPEFQRLVQGMYITIPFARSVFVLTRFQADCSVGMSAIAVLQNALEAYLLHVLHVLHCATLTAVHARRDVILPKHVAIMNRLLGPARDI